MVLCGVRVCKTAFASLLGTSMCWLGRAVRELPDLRTRTARVHTCRETPQSNRWTIRHISLEIHEPRECSFLFSHCAVFLSIMHLLAKVSKTAWYRIYRCICVCRVDRFFRRHYISAAEPLPDDGGKISRVPGAGSRVDADIIRDDQPWLPAGDVLQDAAVPAALDEQQTVVDETVSFVLAEHGVIGLPRRYLSHNCTKTIYWLFVAEERAWLELEEREGSQAIPSYVTFWRRWRAVRCALSK